MSFVTIKDQIKIKLDSITSIQEVHDFPHQDFGGYPSATVRTMGNSSEYETTCEDQEIYAFAIQLFQDIEGEVHTAKQARRIIETLCDEVRDSFDSDEFLTGISLPADRTMIGALPTVSEISEEDSGKYVIADIELAVKISKDIS